MTKKELIEEVAKQCDIKPSVVEDVFDTMRKEIKYRLLNGEKVSFNGFGAFYAKTTPEKIGRNFHTKKAVTIASRNIPHFKVSKTFEKEFNRLSKNLKYKY